MSFEIYDDDITRRDEHEFKGKVCPIMSNVSSMNSGSAWVGIPCIKEKCKWWDERDMCKLVEG